MAINPVSRTTDVEGLLQYGIKTVPMPDVGHFLMLENAAGFNRLLEETLDPLGG